MSVSADNPLPFLEHCPTSNKYVRRWLAKVFDVCQPERVEFCDGSDDEKERLFAQGVEEGVFIKLNQDKLPGCYLHRSDPNDVARVEKLTFICTPSEDDAGPTNNWWHDRDARRRLRECFDGAFAGKTLYVVPFVMGPIGSPLAKVGVQITDSIYVVQNMRIMARMGQVAWDELGEGDEFTRCWHSVGQLDPNERFITHFPFDNEIMSFGSGYGGNALLGKKCLALRIASFLGKREGWMAEHMLIMGVTAPSGEKTYVTGAFPSACGKTNFSMLIPPERYQEAGWKVTTVGDDIAWMWVDEQTGKMRAINPENGYFGVAPGTNEHSNPNASKAMASDTIYTNVALTEDGDVWWEGKTKDVPSGKIINWLGNEWTPDSDEKAAHPNSRFTAPMHNNPALDEAADDPAGVEIKAIIFGGRRSETIPLVFQSFNWVHGVYIGATLGSEGTAAAEGKLGTIRRDPMAMLPFMGYNIRDYLVHWFRMRKKMMDCPRIFHVNWFRRDPETKQFLWPGFGENLRVLEWIVGRCHGHAHAYETPLGWMPGPEDLDMRGLKDPDGDDFDAGDFRALARVDEEAFKAEILGHQELLLRIASDLPKEMIFQRELLISRL